MRIWPWNSLYLGHTTVVSGHVRPIDAKIRSINKFPVPENKRQLMRFLGMAGYYRKLCKNFSTIAAPLTANLAKNTTHGRKSVISPFNIKASLISGPVLYAHNFDKKFLFLSTPAESVPEQF
ncbi:uncharacterized protein [Antedon mediterranea]|uniref:uncharacterized protein n=1 Tax=Antedon mediterranea TaxID=105859 RepID=UPI003AF51A14